MCLLRRLVRSVIGVGEKQIGIAIAAGARGPGEFAKVAAIGVLFAIAAHNPSCNLQEQKENERGHETL